MSLSISPVIPPKAGAVRCAAPPQQRHPECGAKAPKWGSRIRIISSVIPAKAGIQSVDDKLRQMKTPCVYMLASDRNGTLYVGVTSDLVNRVWTHREKLGEGFSKQYGVTRLVWYEVHENMESAITREKAIKKWRRTWKLAAIELTNPHWRDLYDEIV